MTTVAQVTHLADAVGASTELRLHDIGQTLLDAAAVAHDKNEKALGG